jgi:hypothetical protein
MKEDMANFHATIVDPPSAKVLSEADAPSKVTPLSEAFDKPVMKTLDEVQENIELMKASETISFEKRKFDDAFPEGVADTEKIVFNDGTGDKEISIAQLREEFKSDADYISAITSCGIGGG